MRALRLPVAVATLALGLAACGDEEPSGPRPLDPLPAEVYVVQSIEGQALPALVHVAPPVDDDEHTYRVYVQYDTLRLISNGRYEHRARLRVLDESDRLVGQSSRNDRGVWRTVDGTLRFESDMIQHVSFTGARTPGGATLVATQDIVRDADSTPKQFTYARQ